ncbi:unnamed protein product [Lymnaea stagnalis]|uniref:Uncharacterized protein n=1 Tax=Lymnaea stagnalis TaxID=6523 RepID=A0AAV2H3C1_LYMST
MSGESGRSNVNDDKKRMSGESGRPNVNDDKKRMSGESGRSKANGGKSSKKAGEEQQPGADTVKTREDNAGDSNPKRENKTMKGCKFFLHGLVFVFLVGNDIADFVSDWLFFAEVKVAGKGLVYGEPDQIAVWFLLFFSIVGTFTFLFECVNLWWESFRGNPWIDSDILSAVVIWIEDIPQIIISLYLVLCREEPISIFQLTKAAVVIIGVFVRIVVSLVKYCNKDAIRSHHHVKHKVCIMLGVILEALCAIAIFVLTQTERDAGGGVAFRVPTTVIEDTFNDQKYFTNVSIFINQPEYFDAGSLDPDKSDRIFNWLRLSTITKVRASPDREATFSVRYEKNPAGLLKMAMYEKLVSSAAGVRATWPLLVCYSIDQMSGNISQVDDTTCAQQNYFTNASSDVYIKFRFDQPGQFFKKQVLGEIYFNMKVGHNGACTPIHQYTHSIEESRQQNINITLHYFRTNNTINPTDTDYMRHNGSTAARFFRNEDADLIDVTKAWKTGWMECEANGNLGPLLDPDMALDCTRLS